MVHIKKESSSPQPDLTEHQPTPSSDGPKEAPATPTPASRLPAPPVLVLRTPPPWIRESSHDIKIETSPPPLSTRERLEIERLARIPPPRTPPATRSRIVMPPPLQGPVRHRFIPLTEDDAPVIQTLATRFENAKPKPRGRKLATKPQSSKRRKT